MAKPKITNTYHAISNRLTFSRRQSGFLAFALIVFASYVVYQTFAAGLETPTAADQLILEYSAAHGHLFPADRIAAPELEPLRIYGNGLAICSQNQDDNPDVQFATTATQLTQAQIHQLVEQIAATGYLNLKNEYFAKLPIAEHADEIRLITNGGDHFVFYYNDMPKPPAFAKTQAIIQNFCKGVTKPYKPAKVKVTTKKIKDIKGIKLRSDWLSSSPPQKDIQTQILTADQADAARTKLSGKTHDFFKVGGQTFEAAIQPDIPSAKNEQTSVDFAKIRGQKKSDQAHAAGTYDVHAVLVLPSDGQLESGGDATYTLSRVRDWYGSYTGTTFRDDSYVCSACGSVSAIYYASHTKAWLQTCHNSDGCKAPNGHSDMFEAIFENIYASEPSLFHPSESMVLVLGWKISSSVCGLGAIGEPLAVVRSDYPQGCPFGGVMAHELGHNMGLNHTTESSNVMFSGGGCGIPGSSEMSQYVLAGCTLNATQANIVKNTYYFNSSTAPPSSCYLCGTPGADAVPVTITGRVWTNSAAGQAGGAGAKVDTCGWGQPTTDSSGVFTFKVPSGSGYCVRPLNFNGYTINAQGDVGPGTGSYEWQVADTNCYHVCAGSPTYNQDVGDNGFDFQITSGLNPPMITVVGRLWNNSNNGLPAGSGAKIESCGWGQPTTDVNGYFSFQVPQGKGFCVRPINFNGYALSSQGDAAPGRESYEWQIAGFNCYHVCKNIGAYDIDRNGQYGNSDYGYGFQLTSTLNPPKYTVVGRLWNNFLLKQPAGAGAKIDTCGWGQPTSDANGYFQFAVPQGKGFCIHPLNFSAYTVTTQGAQTPGKSGYEYQVAGFNCYNVCNGINAKSWDRDGRYFSADYGYDFQMTSGLR